MRQRRPAERRRGTLSARKVDPSLRRRVREIGGDRFGILAVDISKRNLCVQMADFYGESLWGPEVFPNMRTGIEALLQSAQERRSRNGLQDMVVAIEPTGRYHKAVQRVLGRSWEVRLIHPFTTKQLRQPASRGVKTDGRDLDAIIRAVISGYGNTEPTIPVAYEKWQLVSRARQELVVRRASLKARCQERIQMLMPGFGDLFRDIWTMNTALAVVERFWSAPALRDTGIDTLFRRLRDEGVQCRRETLTRIRAWACEAADPAPTAEMEHRMLCGNLELIRELTHRIEGYECELLAYLVMTPAVLLLSIKGLNVVSASEYGSELGPVSNYPAPANINGRAALYPGRYQSDEVDLTDGPIVGGGNARLRHAMIEIAHNLIDHNDWFRGWAEIRRQAGWPARKIRIAVANRFGRISYRMLTQERPFDHPQARDRDSVLVKLLQFAAQHGIAVDQTLEVVQSAAMRLPAEVLPAEMQAVQDNAWPDWIRCRHYGSVVATSTRQIQSCVPQLLSVLGTLHDQHQENSLTQTSFGPHSR